MTRKETLTKAIDTVCKNREDDYGSPEDNFKTIAALWTTYTGYKITSGDVAIMMALLKIARIKNGTFKEDSYVDLAGYAACAAEVASNAQTKVENDSCMGIPKKPVTGNSEIDKAVTNIGDVYDKE